MSGRLPGNREILTVFLVFLRLGLTSFGGPAAHLGYFREEFVARCKWLSEADYADLIALCQFLPGPASSQVGMAIGLFRGGFSGLLAAWLGFTLPSALIMIACAGGIVFLNPATAGGMLHGLKIVAVAVVVQAVWGMARNLCTDRLRVTVMAISCCLALTITGAAAQVGILIVAAIAGVLLFKSAQEKESSHLAVVYGRRTGACLLAVFAVLLVGLPLLAYLMPVIGLLQADAFYRVGSLVFGGGHVILPLLRNEVVMTGWVDNDVFLAGYGMAQALPGPLTAFAAFLGFSMNQGLSGWSGGLLCLLIIFAPSFLLVAGVLPFWQSIRQNRNIQAALAGVNVAVVGLLLAALYQPVWTSAVFGPWDFALALAAFIALAFWRLPPWLVVILCGSWGYLAAFL